MGDYVNSMQLRFDKSHISCGVMEVHHLPDWTGPKMLFSVATALYHKANPRPTAFIIWSDVIGAPGDAASRGMRLAQAINDIAPAGDTYAWTHDHSITHVPVAGELWSSADKVNPKTGNVIRVWVLTINHDTFRKWYQSELANRIDE